jgi:hypothetical protein
VQSSTHETESLILVRLSLRILVSAAELNHTAKEASDELGRGHDTGALVGNVVLHARLWVDRELSFLINGTSKATVILASVDILGVVLGVVDVLLRAVAAQSLSGNLELAGAVAKGHEAENAKEETDGFGRNGLDSADIDSLGVISEPVSKVRARNVDLVELLAIEGTSQGEGEESIFDIAVSP